MKHGTRRVLVLRHADCEGLGCIAHALSDHGIEYVTVRADLEEPIPARSDGYDALVVMGGPQSAYEQARYPFLRTEINLLERTFASERPVLGICLGSQLMAQVLGAEVYPGERFELGWHDVTLSSNVTNDEVLAGLPQVITPFHWHGDLYDLPPGTVCIGSSAATRVQGFVHNGTSYGFLFHLEVDRDQVSRMVDAFPDDVERGGMDPASLVAESAERANALHELASAAFHRWAAHI